MSEEDKNSKELVHSSRFWAVSDDTSTSKDYNLTEQESSWHRSTEAVRTSTYGAITLEEIKCKQTESNPVEEGDKNLNPSLSATKDLKKDKCYDALVYFNGEHSSFEDSSGSRTSDIPRDPSLICEEAPGYSGEIPTVDVLYNIVIEYKDVVELMDKMWTIHYTASRFPENEIYSKCKGLFEKDYICEVVDNFGGNLSDHYPIRVIIPVSRKRTEECEGSVEFDKEKYSEQVKNSISSRCRTRFVAPVILCDNKFICRAGTLSVRKGAVYESATKNEPPQDQYVNGNIFQSFGYLVRNTASSVAHIVRSAAEAIMNLIDMSSMERMRVIDVQILKELKVQRICDLMIEDRKMFKQIIRVSSSEKIHRDTYRDFNIEQMPYPGCKFFRRYHKTGRRAEGLIFNWNRADVNTDLLLTEDPYTGFPGIEWASYKTWDVIELTKNYMKILLSYIIKGNGGILVHCISGWDRTPLMISLLRVSLWADGVIHETLGIVEMAYLTLAYDWYLFGHNLPARLHHEEEIMHFCFKFLSHIASDEFSSTRIFHELPPELKNRKFPEFKPRRRFNFVHNLSCLVLDIYKAQMTRRAK